MDKNYGNRPQYQKTMNLANLLMFRGNVHTNGRFPNEKHSILLENNEIERSFAVLFQTPYLQLPIHGNL